MPRPQNFFTELGGVSVHYARPPIAPYGSRGKPYNFHVTPEFEEKLVACFEELWEACPFGRAEVVTSAGAYVDKPGYHGQGRAVDIDAIFWVQHDFVTLNYNADGVLYLGIEAVVRKHFGTVLNYLYNASHRDHLHVDDGTEVDFHTSSRSRVLFLQAALTHVFELPVMIDGIYGNQTAGAVAEALRRVGSTGNIENRQTWKKLLSGIAETAFGRTAEERGPPELLRHLYRVIETELSDNPSRKRVETALNAFANHEETQQWLAGLEA